MATYTTSTVPARDRSPRKAKVRLIVVHVNVGPEKENVALALGWLTQRQTGAYHEIVDDKHVVVTAQDDEVVAGAAGANADGWHICLAGMPDQTAEQWADDYSRAELDIAAQRVAAACERFGIPARFIDSTAVKNGESGICGHKQVSDAYHKSTHWDPGPNFPWPAFIERVARELHPDKEDDVEMDDAKFVMLVAKAVEETLTGDGPTSRRVQRALEERTRKAVADLFDDEPGPAAKQVQSKIRELLR